MAGEPITTAELQPAAAVEPAEAPTTAETFDQIVKHDPELQALDADSSLVVETETERQTRISDALAKISAIPEVTNDDQPAAEALAPASPETPNVLASVDKDELVRAYLNYTKLSQSGRNSQGERIKGARTQTYGIRAKRYAAELESRGIDVTTLEQPKSAQPQAAEQPQAQKKGSWLKTLFTGRA